MKKLLFSLLFINIIFIGCGSEDATEVENDEIIASYSYYNIGMLIPADDSFGLSRDYGNYSVFSKSDTSWDSILVLDVDGLGVAKIELSNDYLNDDYGTRAKSLFNTAKTALDTKYTLLNDFDFCTGTDYVCQSNNYAYSLYREERYKARFYIDNETNAGVTLEIVSAGFDDTRVRIRYEAEEFGIWLDELENDSVDNL